MQRPKGLGGNFRSKPVFLHESGVTMVEILVTVIISAIGFLGLASVQLLGTKQIAASNYRSLATIYAYDMAERMRSNPNGLDLKAYDSINPDGSEPETSAKTFCTNNCTVGQVAERDIIEWNQQIQGEVTDGGLPNGIGRVEFEAARGMHVITVEWTEVVVIDRSLVSERDASEDISSEGETVRVDQIQEFVLEVKL